MRSFRTFDRSLLLQLPNGQLNLVDSDYHLLHLRFADNLRHFPSQDR